MTQSDPQFMEERDISRINVCFPHSAVFRVPPLAHDTCVGHTHRPHPPPTYTYKIHDTFPAYHTSSLFFLPRLLIYIVEMGSQSRRSFSSRCQGSYLNCWVRRPAGYSAIGRVHCISEFSINELNWINVYILLYGINYDAIF